MFNRKKHERKYQQHFRYRGCRAHCFTYVTSEEIVQIDKANKTFLDKLFLDPRILYRLTRMIKKFKHQVRARKIKRINEKEEVLMLAQKDSSMISIAGSVYEVLPPSRTFLVATDSDMDTRIQKKIMNFFKPQKVRYKRTAKIMDVWETMYEEHMAMDGAVHITREDFLRKDEDTLLATKIKRTFQKFLHYQRGLPRLTKTELYMCLLLYEFNISQLVNFGHAFNDGGVAATVVLYIFVSFFIQMPFNMWIFTMVSYTDGLILRLFSDSMPLISAIKYPLIFIYLVGESRRLLNLEAVLKFAYYNIAFETPWVNCTTAGAAAKGTIAEGVVCVPIGTTTPHNVNCTDLRTKSSEYEFFSTQFFVQYELFRTGNAGDANAMDFRWGDPSLRYYGIIYGIIFMLWARGGMVKIKKFTIKAQFFIILLASVCVICVGLERIADTSYTWNYVHINITFVLTVFSLCMQTNGIPILIWFASMKPEDLKPSTCSVIHQFIKTIVLTILSCTYGVLAYDISRRYKMFNTHCFSLEANDIIFSMVPDLFSTFRFSKIWLMSWLMCMMFIVGIYSVYNILATSDSIIQVLPHRPSYATLFTFLVIVIIICMRLVNEIPYAYQILYNFESKGLCYINNFHFSVLVLSIYFLYTPVRLCREYEFIWGYTPASFWIISWHYTVAIAFLILLVDIMAVLSNGSAHNYQYVITAFFITCASWLLFGNCVFLCYKGIKVNNLENLVYPSKNWGPSNLEKRKEFQQRVKLKHLDVRVTCPHKCFLNNAILAQVISEQKIPMRKLANMRGTALYYWYIRETELKEETVQFFNASIIDH